MNIRSHLDGMAMTLVDVLIINGLKRNMKETDFLYDQMVMLLVQP